MKNRTTAGVFALLLGGIGVHKFYLGKTIQGILYLLFFWTLIPGFIALIEGIRYLTMSDEEFNEKYNSISIGKTLSKITPTNEKILPKIVPTNSNKDDIFIMKAFLEIQNRTYDEKNGFDRLMVEMIQEFVNYMNSFDEYYLHKFKGVSDDINEINKSVGDNEIKYNDILLKLYKEFYNIKS